MNEYQKKTLQIMTAIAAVIILIPPLKGYPEYGFLFSLHPFAEINFIHLSLRLALVALISFFFYLHFGAVKERQLINISSFMEKIVSYGEGKEPLLSTLFIGAGGACGLFYLTYWIIGPFQLRGMFTDRREFEFVWQEYLVAGGQNTAPFIFIPLLIIWIIYSLWGFSSIWNASTNLQNSLLGVCLKLILLAGLLFGIIILKLTYDWFVGEYS